MAHVAITVRPLLGGVQGHLGAGEPDRIPSPARLFSAFVNAAGQGSAAVERDGQLRLSEESVAALEWLESTPPSAIRVPAAEWELAAEICYREEGVFEDGKGASRKVGKPRAHLTSLQDELGWAWDLDAPDAVVETLDALAADISCLGEADTPVVVELKDFEPTHLLSANQSPFVRQAGLQLRIPMPGRLAALEEQYSVAYPKKGPTKNNDKHSWSERPTSERPTPEALRQVTYAPVSAQRPQLPWVEAFALRVDRPVPVSDRVRWAVTFHRALVAFLGNDAPSVVTGRYPQGKKRPANRVAIQYVSGPTMREELRAGAFLVMLPAGVEAAEREALVGALTQMTRLYRGRAGEIGLTFVGSVPADEIWLPPMPGMKRLWRTAPAMVPETRRPQRANGWTLKDAALVSIGLVYRDDLQLAKTRGEARYMSIRDQVAKWDVRAVEAHRVADSQVERYVHRTPEHLVAQPCDVVFDMGERLGDQAILAVGQARHLGGGLLHPLDVPEDLTGENHVENK